MSYLKLSIPPGTPPDVAQFVRDRLEPFLCDVHAMLRLPMDEIPGLEAGCNFTSTLTLLEVIGGVSEELYLDPRERTEGIRKYNDATARFKKVLEEHFPWSQEPRTGEEIVGADAAEVLFRAYRCALAHNLGNVRSKDFGGVLKVAKGPLDEEEIVAIEQSVARPTNWTRPTLRLIQDGGEEERKLTVKCFYWGVRRMVENVLATRAKLASESDAPAGGRVVCAEVTATTTQSFVQSGPTTRVSSGSTD